MPDDISQSACRRWSSIVDWLLPSRAASLDSCVLRRAISSFFSGPHTWGINEKGPLQAAATRRESMSAKGGNVKIKAG